MKRSCGALLDQAGWRCTRQRAAVFACLQTADCHPTAEQVFASVRRQLPHISLATVYKALEALVSAGLAARIAHESGAARYDARSDAHYHLRCERTGEVRDLQLPYDPHLIEKIAPELAEALRPRASRSPAIGWSWWGDSASLSANGRRKPADESYKTYGSYTSYRTTQPAHATRAAFRRRNSRRNTRVQRRPMRFIQSCASAAARRGQVRPEHQQQQKRQIP